MTYGIPVAAGLIYRDSVEIDELKHPLEVKRLALVPGSGGAGKYRGAPSSIIEFGIKSKSMTVIYPGDGQEVPPRGVRGGQDGALAGRWVIRADGSTTKLPNAARVELGPGDNVRGIDCSGGGYGPPVERDPERVRLDVLERYETEERAAEIYGVAFTSSPVGEATAVDRAATQRKRQELANRLHQTDASR